MRMSQSIDEFESALAEEMELDRQVARAQVRHAAVRTRRRHAEQQSRRSTVRFVLLVAVLLATAVLVTIAMFQALYLVMG